MEMKLKLLMVGLLLVAKFSRIKSADPFDDQPKILVNDGNLVIQSADSKNVSVQLMGKSRFIVNNVDILESLQPSNGSSTGGAANSDMVSTLAAQVARLRNSLTGQSGILNRLERVESGIPANATLPPGGTDRSRFNAMNRRISLLEQKVANLTLRLLQDHCKSYPCKNGGSCFNMFETFRCECPASWEGPTCEVDVNECSKFAGTDLGCQNGATCINTMGSYSCACTDSWKGQNCNRKIVDCLNVAQSEICGHGTCVQTKNKLGYTCICEQGWRVSNETMSCTVDVDECNEMRPHCSADPAVFCINTPGSFVCGPCPAGYTGNGYSCLDINECDTNNGGCSVSPKVECINSRGSSRCGNCPFGYDGDGRTCFPSSTRPNQQCSDSSICNENAQCVQYPNSLPICICKAGYIGSGFGPGGCAISNADPCTLLNCRNGGTCMKNTTGAYCNCPTGTSPPNCDRFVDPCSPNPCLNGGTCNARRFGRFFTCSCMTGFSGRLCTNQARRCGGVLTELNGTISYPETKGTYYHNSKCAWLIKTNITKVVKITFKKFDIEHSGECKFDWLQIHDGRSSSSFMIGRFCGNQLPKGGTIVSTHNQVYFWFRSDNSTAAEGFELTYESVDPVCGGDLNITTHGTIATPGSPGNYPMNSNCEWFITAPPGKRIQFLFYTLMIEAHDTCGYDYVEIHSGLGVETSSLGKYCNSTNPPPLLTPGNTATIHFHSDGDSNDVGFQIAFSVVEGVPGCGGIYTASKGEVMSPTGIDDGKYKHNMICEYVLQMPTGSRVRVDFKKFALEESAGCKFDRVEIFEGNIYEGRDENLIGRYCGEAKPPIITSQTNIVTVKFTSDWSSSDEGFQFAYQLVCGGTYTAESGSISSPNYPSPYAGERNCEYDISAPQGKVIVLNVVDFDMEQHSACDFDNLEIFDGFQADNATSFGRFCGQVKPGTLVSTFNHMHVHFSSDASINGRGFNANYSFVDVECGGIVKDASEIIKSPLDTDANGLYKSNVECRWLVYAPKGFVIQMNFVSFDLEMDAQCKYDYVKVFNNGSGMGDEVGPFCGSNIPKTITTTDNIATVLFKTDASTAKEGFSISLSFIDGSKLCGANYFSSHGVIRSPGTPEYLSNKECEWSITVPNGQQIEINFKYFEMEEHTTCRYDGLEIRNGANSFAPLIGKFCGTTVPAPFKSFSNHLHFKFTSDASRAAKGFLIEWDGTTAGCGGQITQPKASISSPNYPTSYAHNAQCEWRISVNEGSAIHIVFTDLDMEVHNDCKYDFIEIFDGSEASANSLGKYCSSENHPTFLETTANHALLRMQSDESHSGRGFNIKYTTQCNRTIRMDSGVIESPNFPNDYPNNLDCSWTIIVSRGNRIRMQFSHFFVENDNQFHNDTNEHICKYDFLELVEVDFEEDSHETGPKIKFCNSAPDERVTSTDAVRINFHTDQSASGSGFRMEWNIEGCGGKLYKDAGELTSPNFPKRYPHDLTCKWEIVVDYGYNIEVTVQELDIESSRSCEYDSLIIANDKSFNQTALSLCSSIHAPVVYTSDSHKIFVKFESDESNNGRGFTMSYKRVMSGCGGLFRSSEGFISTPNYPKTNYENKKTCEWSLETDLMHTLSFQLTDFDLEQSENCTKDRLEVFDPTVSKLLWVGCGSQMPNQTTFTSNRNQLTVRLFSDDDINAKGFKGNFSNNCGSRIVVNNTGELEYRALTKYDICTWILVASDPSMKVTVTFSYISVFFDGDDGCVAKVDVFDGDSDQGALKKSFCGTTAPPSITSNGGALTIRLNSTMVGGSEFDIHYSVLDNACGGTYKSSTAGEFASPNYPESTPLGAFCIWNIEASEGNKLSLTFTNFDVASSPSCNENYLEIRKGGRNGTLIGSFCGNELPANIEESQKYWIKYQTDAATTSNGFLAEFKYIEHSELSGKSGVIESPTYPKPLTMSARNSYRVAVKQGSVILLEFPFFSLEEEDDEDCYAFMKIYNGYDDEAPLLQDETCGESPASLTSETNVVFIEFSNNFMSKAKFQMTWKEVDRAKNLTGTVDSECGDKAISLNNETTVVNITSPGYPHGYASQQMCTWTIVSAVQSFHPVITFGEVDLEDVTDCIADNVEISSDREDGSWRELGKLCSVQAREMKVFEGTPSLRVKFKSDYGTNGTGFRSLVKLECGGKMTDSEGVIEYNTTNLFSAYRIRYDCKWNITVRRGKTIRFEFLQMDIHNTSNVCNSFVTIRNGIDESSPYLGTGQYCGKVPPTIPATSSNRAFVKYKIEIPMFNSFKLRYYEVQEQCGGQIKLSATNQSVNISSPNYPNIPSPHIVCVWTILAPVGERIRLDFYDRFDLTYSVGCEKEYVELKEGSTTSSNVIGRFCRKPATQKSRSNLMTIKFFTDIPEPKNGFIANVSIDICGGSTTASSGFLISPNYPGLGAYPRKAQCDYRISGIINQIFNITILDLDLPEPNLNQTCDTQLDHIVMYSVMPSFNLSGTDELIPIGTFCGNSIPAESILSESSELLISFRTAERTKALHKGFKIFYKTSTVSCGGVIEGESGIITSSGYPSRTLTKMFCEWRITVPKGRRVKVEFIDVDFAASQHDFMQRIGLYNGFMYANNLRFVSKNASATTVYSSDNRMMITLWVKIASTNRGFKLKFTSEDRTICVGNLNAESGQILPPPSEMNLTNFACEYERDVQPIAGLPMGQGTLVYNFKDVSVGRKTMNCMYASTSVKIKRSSGANDDEKYLAAICGNETTKVTIASPFADTILEMKQVSPFGKANFIMNYKSNKCGGILGDGVHVIKNIPANVSNEKVLDCAWFAKFEAGYSVLASISKLNMKLSCDEEYIKVYNGPTPLSPLLKKYCRTEEVNLNVTSQNNMIFIEYHTEDFVGNSKESTFELQIQQSAFGCGGVLTKSKFSFTTPLYDKPYPPNTECIWEIHAEKGYHVGLVFNDRFFIEDSSNCMKDFVEIFDFVGSEWTSLGKRCGRDIPKPFNSTAEKMKIIFHSDDTTNTDGFSAVWNPNCGGIFTADETLRILHSPGYPKSYGPYLNCNYTFVAPNPTSYVNIRFTDFAIEATNSKCLYDNATIYKNPDYIYQYPVIPERVGVFCGAKNPGKFRHKGLSTIVFKTDRWIERKGFEVEYQLDSCGGFIDSSKVIKSPEISTSNMYQGTVQCVWNISAPADQKIVVKFEEMSLAHSDYCSYDFVEIFNGTLRDDKQKLAKVCGNLTNTIRPIIIQNNRALFVFSTDQTNSYTSFSAAVYFMPRCDQKIELTGDNSVYVLDKTNQIYNRNMECLYTVVAEPTSVLRISLSDFNLPKCEPKSETDSSQTCDCNYLEIHDGNGPFSEVIGKVCGHQTPIPFDIVSTRSAVYMRFVVASSNLSTGFKATITMITSPCGLNPFQKFVGNETEPVFVTSPTISLTNRTYPLNIRCLWTATAPFGRLFDIQFYRFELEDSDDCSKDFLMIEDKTVSEFITEGLGEEIIYRGRSTQTHTPSFYSGISGPTAPHVYCGSALPTDYISQSNTININFNSDSEKQYSGFNFSIRVLSACSRNFTALQGRLVSDYEPEECKSTIKVPANHTISLYFHRFFFYESDCAKSFLKIYDGDFETGVLLQTFCGYAMPDPIFSRTNQISLFFFYGEATKSIRGNYDIMYLATDKGRGCGGEIFNFAGIFSSPLFPSGNRSLYDCTWSVSVPSNLKVAFRFATFDMGTNIQCSTDYVEFLEEDENKQMVSIKRYCGGDEPAVYVSLRSKVLVHHVQTLNFAGTGWLINFLGIKEGAQPHNW